MTVDDAAWATLHTRSGVVASLEVSRVATGRKNALQVEVYGTTGSLRFDLERLNELVLHESTGSATDGPKQILVTEPELVKELLTTPTDAFVKSPVLRRTRALLGD